MQIYVTYIEWRTASICSPSSVPTAGHQPFVRLRSNNDTVSTFRLECSPTAGSWWRPHLRAFLAGFGILFKFISSWPGKEKTTNEELLKRIQLKRALPFVERFTYFCWFSCVARHAGLQGGKIKLHDSWLSDWLRGLENVSECYRPAFITGGEISFSLINAHL